jgi:uncharacterized protein YjiS (DUF1127 family)
MSANSVTLTATRSSTSKSTIIPTLVGMFASMVLRIREYRNRRADLVVLRSMSDRELKDIGLSRGDVERVTRM